MDSITQLTDQEVFNNALFGLRKQGVKSTTINGVCAYRGTIIDQPVLRCGIGFSIPDTIYKRDMDSRGDSSISELVETESDIGYLFELNNPSLLNSIQYVHDMYMPTKAGESLFLFEQEMEDAAKIFNLLYTSQSESKP